MKVENYPLGYLALIGAKNAGRALEDAGETLSPVVDITNLLGANLRQVINVNGGIAVGNNNTYATVPAGEVWRFISGSFFFQAGAGATAADLTAYLLHPNELGGVNYVSDSIDIAASQVEIRRLHIPYGYLATPGTVFGAYASAVTGAPAGNLSMLVERLKA